MNPIESAIERTIWQVDVSGLPLWRAVLTRIARILHAIINDLVEGQITLRAMSLVYTTLLSLVPLLAVSFSVLKGFGVHNQIEPLLANFLTPLGPKGAEITQNVVGFVENMKIGVLGSVGLAMLFYTVVSLIQKIESSFNYTWHTSSSRTMGQRFSDYLSVIMVGPILMVAALGLTATVTSATIVQRISAIEPFGLLLRTATEYAPYVLVIGAFTFVYAFVPNTKVKLRAALAGGVVGGIMWETAGWGFASFVAGSGKYAAIYSGFAILILFMIWLYVSWLILLIGASIAFYVQNPEHLTPRREVLRLSGRVRERIGLILMARIAGDHTDGRPPSTRDELAQWLGVPAEVVDRVIELLDARGLLAKSTDDPPGFLPARSAETLQVKEVLAAVRTADETSRINPERLPGQPGVDRLIEQIERAVEGELGEKTLKELASPN